MAQKRDLPTRIVIKNKETKVRVGDGFLEVQSDEGEWVVGFLGKREVYLHKDLEIKVSEIFEISKYLKVFLIDANGNILGEFARWRVE